MELFDVILSSDIYIYRMCFGTLGEREINFAKEGNQKSCSYYKCNDAISVTQLNQFLLNSILLSFKRLHPSKISFLCHVFFFQPCPEESSETAFIILLHLFGIHIHWCLVECECMNNTLTWYPSTSLRVSLFISLRPFLIF